MSRKNWKIGAGAMGMAMAAGLAGTARGQLIVDEPFNYGSGTDITGQSGGSGWVNAWSDASGASTPGIFQTRSSGQSYSTGDWDLRTSGLSARGFGGTGMTPSQNSAVLQRSWGSADQLSSAMGTAWVSFIALQDSGQTSNTWLGIKLIGTGTSLFIGKVRNGSNWAMEANNDPSTMRSTSTPTTQLAFVLVRVDLNNGDVHLWVNPPTLEQEPALTTADLSATGYATLTGCTKVLLDAGTTAANDTIEGTLDELRIGRRFEDVTPATPKPASCERTGHGVTVTARPGMSIDGRVEEKWTVKTKVRSTRWCNPPKYVDRSSNPRWQRVPNQAAVHPRDKRQTAPDSTAYARSEVKVDTWTSKVISLRHEEETSHDATGSGCPGHTRRFWNWGRALAKAVCGVRVVGNVETVNAGFAGLFRNEECAGVGRERRPGVRFDPVELEVTDLNGQLLFKDTLIDVMSRVDGGYTVWEPRLSDVAPRRTRVLENTSPDMTLSMSVSSPLVPPQYHGTLDVTARGNRITAASGTGVFAALAGPGRPISTSNPTAYFSVPLPTIPFETNVPGDPTRMIASLSSTGATVSDAVSDNAVAVGCQRLTNNEDGVQERDTSRPLGSNTGVGTPIGAGLAMVAQAFDIPAGPSLELQGVGLYAFQIGTPLSLETATTSATVMVWDRDPSLAGAVQLAAFTGAAEWELTEMDAVSRGAVDDGSRPMYEVGIASDLSWGGFSLPPGRYWVGVSLAGIPGYGPVELTPCRETLPTSSTGGWSVSQDVATGVWHRATDPGSGEYLRAGFDVYAAEPTPDDCGADFNGDGFVDFFDYLDFVLAFDSGDPAADTNLDGFVDFFDYATFVESFEQGC